ncbi:MAG: response regulator transcription factor [Actinomycetota bacterium]|nr:response regulator transcription factor [Actinomycetota bacterium]
MPTETSLLLVEDDKELGQSISIYLEANAFDVTWVLSAKEAKAVLWERHFEVVLLDIVLPDGDGLELCEEIRSSSRWTPTLVLSALGSLDDRLKGFSAGADDYLTKPFSLAELVARIRAVLRRGSIAPGVEIRFGNIVVDQLAHRAFVADREVRLSSREISLLVTLIQHEGTVLSRAMLLKSVWHDTSDVAQNIVDQYIRRLRMKVCTILSRVEIETLHGQGYRIRRVA